jgi:hypothetical protein
VTRTLTSGLVREGTTDERFLTPLLGRLIDDLLVDSRYPADAGPVGAVTAADGDDTYADRVASTVATATGVYDLLFIHADGDGQPVRARQERTDPIIARIEKGERPPACVAVVPQRMTEAWLLADPDAFRSVLGTNRSTAELGLPRRARDVEKIAAPKTVLQDALGVARARRPRRRRRAAAPFEPLGDVVSLARLREVPAFERLQQDLTDVLQRLHLL